MKSADYRATLDWDRDIGSWVAEVSSDALDALEAAFSQIVDRYAPQIESWMKANAPWTDRTANARQGLHAETEKLVKDSYNIVLTHGVEYGYWLELKNQGRYAIIQPALDHWFPIILAEVRRVLS